MLRSLMIMALSIVATTIYAPPSKAGVITKELPSIWYKGTSFSLHGFFVRTRPINDQGSEETVRLTIDPKRNEVAVDFLFNLETLNMFPEFASFTSFILDPLYLSTSDVISIRHGVYTSQHPGLGLPETGLPIFDSALDPNSFNAGSTTLRHYFSDGGRRNRSTISIQSESGQTITDADRYNEFGFENVNLDPSLYSRYSNNSGTAPSPAQTYDYFEGISSLTLPIVLDPYPDKGINTVMTRTIFSFDKNVMARKIPTPWTIFYYGLGVAVVLCVRSWNQNIVATRG